MTTTLYQQARALTPENAPVNRIAAIFVEQIGRNMGIPHQVAVGVDVTSYSASALVIKHYAPQDRRDAERARDAGLMIPVDVKRYS